LKRIVILMLVGLLLINGMIVAAAPSDNSSNSKKVESNEKNAPKKGKYNPKNTKYIVKFHDSDKGNAKIQKNKKSKKLKRSKLLKIDLTEEEFNALHQDENVAFIEEDYAVTSTEDTISPSLQLIQGLEAHQSGYTGKGVKVAVLDTGISPSAEIRVRGGVSFVDNEASHADTNGHGTHVAGTLAALDDDKGLLGVAPDVELYAVKVLDKTGKGYYSNVIEGLEWAIDNDMDIVSMSFGGKENSQALLEAIQLAKQHDIVLLAAAGNDGSSIVHYPARYPDVVSIGAIDENQILASFSNYGKVDAVAPGTKITSINLDGTYSERSGTSMAVPYATGIAALILEQNPNFSAQEVKDRLLRSSTALGDTMKYGYGLLNASRALSPEEAPWDNDADPDMPPTNPDETIISIAPAPASELSNSDAVNVPEEILARGPPDKEFTVEAASRQTPDPDVLAAINMANLKQFSAPFSIDDSQESISTLGGSLHVGASEFTLPGRGGLSFTLQRYYDSASANFYEQEAEATVDCLCRITYYGTEYQERMAPDGTIYENPTSHRSGQYEYSWRYNSSDTFKNWIDGGYWLTYISSKTGDVVSRTNWSNADQFGFRTRTVYKVDQYPNISFFDDWHSYIPWGPGFRWRDKADLKTKEEQLFPIGKGWKWNVPYIKGVENKVYLNLSDGSSYELYGTTLKNYPWKDITISYDSSVVVGAKTSHYKISYLSGQHHYFSPDGKLIKIKDNYDNYIDFHYADQDKYTNVLSKIVDPIGNAIEITYSGLKVFIKQGNRTTTYNKYVHKSRYSTEPRSHLDTFLETEILSSVKEADYRWTSYEYNFQYPKYSLFSTTASMTNPVALLKRTNYSTGAYTEYNYESQPTTRYLSKSAVEQEYRIASRRDVSDEGAVYNHQTYSYSGDMGSSYDQDHAFSTIVNDLRTITTHEFTKDYVNDSTPSRYYMNRVVAKKDSTEHVTEYQYDTAKPEITVPIKTRTYTKNGSHTSSTLEANQSFDAYGNVTSSTNSVGNQIIYEYDPTSRLLIAEREKVDPVQTRITTYERNAQGSVVSIKVTDQNGQVLGNVKYEGLDSHGNPTKVTVKDSGRDIVYLHEFGTKFAGAFLTKQTVQVKNVDNQVETVRVAIDYEPSGLVKSVTDGNGFTSAYLYDAFNRVTRITNHDQSYYSVTYDDSRNKVTERDETGVTFVHKWDSLGNKVEEGVMDGSIYRLLKKYKYDAFSRLDWEEEGNTRPQRKDYVYDAWNRVQQIIMQDGSYSTFAYDDIGRTVTFTDPEGVVTKTYSDQLGQNIKVEENIGSGFVKKSSTEYNLQGAPVKAADAYFTTSYKYNAAGQLTNAINAKGEETRYVYSLAGSLTEMHHPDGKIVRKAYDELGRLIKQTDPMGQVEKIYYDGNGNIIKDRDKKGKEFNYIYNNRNMLTGKSSPDGNITYTYDLAGRRKSMTDATGVTTFGYKLSTGELTSVTFPDQKQITYTYDPNQLGLRSSMKDPFGYTLVYQYDALNRLKSVGPTTTTNEVSYSYFKNGLIKEITQRNGNKSVMTYAGHSLDTVTHRKANGDEINHYNYDQDYNGNITTITSRVSSPINTAESFTYDELNRIKTVSNFNEIYNYDNRGNRQTLQSSNIPDVMHQDAAYEYDSMNRLTKYSSGATVVQYRYNGDGMLYERTEGGQTTRYYYDGDQIIAEANVVNGVASLKARYIRGNGLVARQGSDNSTAYYLHNGHGDVVDLWNASGSERLNSYAYDIWGNVLVADERIDNPFQYSGELWDARSGLQYLRARWYDPSVGRFITEDTYEGQIDNPLSLNLYAYVHNNPLKYSDPTGHKVWLIHGTNLGKREDPESTWTPDFIEYIGDLYDEDVNTFRWSGGNNKPARKEGAEALAEEIIKWREENPDEPIRLVGHSHGGNVAIMVANLLGEDDIKVETLVTIATPVREYQLKQEVGQHLHVYNDRDSIQINGGSPWLLLKARRTFTAAANVKIEVDNKNDNIEAHSAMHSNVAIWEKYIQSLLADFYVKP